MKTRHALIVFAALILGSIAASAQSVIGPSDAARNDRHDLRISDKPRAVVIEARAKAEGKITFKLEGSTRTHLVDYATEARWLDEVGATGGPAVHHRRTFLQFRRTDGGKNQDPGLEGVCIKLARIDDEVVAEARAPRQILKSVLDQQRSTAAAVGLYVELPVSSEVGASFPFQGQALLATLLNIGSDIEGFKSEVTLERVDLDAGRAYLTGTATLGSRFEKAGTPYVTSYEGVLKLEVDLVSRTLAQVSFVGMSKVTGRGSAVGKVDGKVAFDTSATATAVTDVKPYAVKNPVFRDNVHQVGGATFSLPSCWMQLPQKEAGTRAYVDSRVEGAPAIEVRYGLKPTGDEEVELMTRFLTAARRESPDVKATKATFPSGDGFTFECTAETNEKVRGFVAPVGSGLVRVRIVGAPSAVKKAESALKGIQASLNEAED